MADTVPLQAQRLDLTKAQLLRDIAWRDLTGMTRRDGLIECLHPLPWLAASLVLAQIGLFAAAVLPTFMFFLTALRLNHEAIHRNLGLAQAGHHLVLHGLSMVMLGSNHAVAWNHLRHHRHIGTAADLEGKAGRMGLVQVLAYGPLFAIETHRDCWRLADRATRGRMAIDLALNLVVPLLALALHSEALAYHLAMMLGAQCMTAFFAVWITHHGCNDQGGHVLIARTQRHWLINRISYNMFFHLEHHTFPAVPVKRLDELARRIDRGCPAFAANAARVLG